MSEVGFTAELNGWYTEAAILNSDFIDFKLNYTKNDFFGIDIKKSIHSTTFEIINLIKRIIEKICNVPVKTQSVNAYTFSLKVTNEIFIKLNCKDSSPWEKKTFSLEISAYGSEEILTKFFKDIDGVVEVFDSVFVKWNYIAENKRMVKQIILPKPKNTIFKEFYPMLKMNPFDYIDEFLESQSNILILRGEPGTGKTSFIRHLISRKQIYNTMITYEEKLFDSDDLFAEFISGEYNCLILEDADKMLTDRVRTGNSAMTRFLNVSDGLIKFPEKKIIITANCMEDHAIDEALLRPGRCFNAPIFHKLSYKETLEAAIVAGLTPPSEDKSYSLAELFTNKTTKQKNPFKIGLI